MHCCTYKHTHAQTHILRFYIIGLYRCMCVYLYVYTVYTSAYACTQVSWSQHDIWGRVIQRFLWIPYGQYCRNSSGYDSVWPSPFMGKSPMFGHLNLHPRDSILQIPGCISTMVGRASRFGAICAVLLPSRARNLRNTRLHTDPATAKQCFVVHSTLQRRVSGMLGFLQTSDSVRIRRPGIFKFP